MGEVTMDDGKTFAAGQSLFPLTKNVTQEMINRWAGVSGDFNPLHVDPEYGKSTFFKTNIAHGPMTLSIVLEMLAKCFGRHWISGGRLYDVRIVSPVPPETQIIAGGEVVCVKQEGRCKTVECEIFVKNQSCKLIVTGKASCKFME
jgi:3-hydroxybutyryl-CoA dehydratase